MSGRRKRASRSGRGPTLQLFWSRREWRSAERLLLVACWGRIVDPGHRRTQVQHLDLTVDGGSASCGSDRLHVRAIGKPCQRSTVPELYGEVAVVVPAVLGLDSVRVAARLVVREGDGERSLTEGWTVGFLGHGTAAWKELAT